MFQDRVPGRPKARRAEIALRLGARHTRHGAEHNGEIRDVSSYRTYVIERRAQCDDAVAWELAEGGLQAGKSTDRRGYADGSAGVGADRREAHALEQRDRGAAARAAGRSRRVPRMAHGSERGLLAR